MAKLGTGSAQAIVSITVFLACSPAFSHPENKAYLDLQAGPNGQLEAELGVPNALTSTITDPTFKTSGGACTADVLTRRVLGPPTNQNQTRWRVQCPAAAKLSVEFPGLGAPVLVSLGWRDKTQTELLNASSNRVTLNAPGLGVRPKNKAPQVTSPPAAAPAKTAADKKRRRQTRWSIAAGALALLIFVIAIVRGR